ncbi:MAG: RNA polymerase sigma factor [Alphaproteobacteria bacterium]|nr:MAG: RNA polymerase sigma factor [Alphaproteobacteria bacterium]
MNAGATKNVTKVKLIVKSTKVEIEPFLPAFPLAPGGTASSQSKARGRSGPDVTKLRRQDPDETLIRAVAEGDAAAATLLVDRYLKEMTALAYRMLGNAFEAEEVAQDVFMKVWLQAPNWRYGEAKLRTWMHRVAMNACLDRLRKKREVTGQEIPDRPDSRPNAIDQMVERERSQRVRTAIADLPDRQRAALTLCHYHGLSNKEAADSLSISVEAIESLLARARRSLRSALLAEKEELLGLE